MADILTERSTAHVHTAAGLSSTELLSSEANKPSMLSSALNYVLENPGKTAAGAAAVVLGGAALSRILNSESSAIALNDIRQLTPKISYEALGKDGLRFYTAEGETIDFQRAITGNTLTVRSDNTAAVLELSRNQATVTLPEVTIEANTNGTVHTSFDALDKTFTTEPLNFGQSAAETLRQDSVMASHNKVSGPGFFFRTMKASGNWDDPSNTWIGSFAGNPLSNGHWPAVSIGGTKFSSRGILGESGSSVLKPYDALLSELKTPKPKI